MNLEKLLVGMIVASYYEGFAFGRATRFVNCHSGRELARYGLDYLAVYSYFLTLTW